MQSLTQMRRLAHRLAESRSTHARSYLSSQGLFLALSSLIANAHRLAGIYVGGFSIGRNLANCQLPTRFELVINLKTAKALGIAVPLSLLGRADQVIE